MNRDNIKSTINIVKRSVNFSMIEWQELGTHPVIKTEKGLHSCGMAACLGGLIAVSPEFIRDGGSVGVAQGEPVIRGWQGSDAIAYWLDIPNQWASILCFTDREGSAFYGKKVLGVTPEDVIEKLEKLLHGNVDIIFELKYFINSN